MNYCAASAELTESYIFFLKWSSYDKKKFDQSGFFGNKLMDPSRRCDCLSDYILIIKFEAYVSIEAEGQISFSYPSF